MDGASRRTRSKRTRLLDQLDEQYRNAKRARFERVVSDPLDDLDSDSSDATSLSGVSGVSGDTGEINSGQDASDLDESVSFSDIEDRFFTTRDEMILRLMTEIETTRVIDPLPRIDKASQLHLLDEWRAINHPNFRTFDRALGGCLLRNWGAAAMSGTGFAALWHSTFARFFRRRSGVLCHGDFRK